MIRLVVQDKPLFPDILWGLPQNINKHARGSVLVIAGSSGMAGAGVLAAEGVLRIGAGLVTLAHPDNLIDVYAKMLPETMTLPLPSTPSGSISKAGLGEVLNKAGSYDVVAIGPGLSKNPETLEFVAGVLSGIKKPKVVDASAIYALSGHEELIDEFSVLTPHSGEMRALMKFTKEDKAEVAREFCENNPKPVLVLKGHHTVIARGGEIIENRTGNPGMAKAGMGDVLTGLIAGLLAQNPLKILESAATAVYLHGLAGDLAAETMGERPLVPSDLLKYLPAAVKKAEGLIS